MITVLPVGSRNSRVLLGGLSVDASFFWLTSMIVSEEKITLFFPPVFPSRTFFRTPDTELALAQPRYTGMSIAGSDYEAIRALKRGGLRLTNKDVAVTFWALDRPKAIRVLEGFGWDIADRSRSVWLR